MFDFYKSEENVRYAMGNTNGKILMCIGVNPSIADEKVTDNTINSLNKHYSEYGYDSWIMFNLYPFRSTDPNKLPTEIDENLHQNNIRVYKEFLVNSKNVDILAAWGVLIKKRDYLSKCLIDIYNLTKQHKWFCLYKTKNNHPKHWNRSHSVKQLEEFDIWNYIAEMK